MTKFTSKSSLGVLVAIIGMVVALFYWADRSYTHDKELYQARLANHFTRLTHYSRNFVRDEIEYQIYQINYFDQISNNTVAPKDQVFASVNYFVKNPSKKLRQVRIEPGLLVTPDGKKYAPDSQGMAGYDISYLTRRVHDVHPYTATLTLKPGEQYDVFAVYLIPKSQATENARLLIPEEIEEKSDKDSLHKE